MKGAKGMKTMVLMLATGLGIVGILSEKLAAQTPFEICYTFDGVTRSTGTTDPTPPPEIQGMTWGSFHAVGYTGDPVGAGKFIWASNELGGVDGDDDFSDFTGHLNKGKYFEVTVAPDAARTLNLDTIEFSVRRSAGGIRNYAVRSSLDDFASNLTGVISTGNTNLRVAPDNCFQWVFDGASPYLREMGSRVVLGTGFDAVSVPIAFRFYCWNAESGDGTFAIDDVYFKGSVQTTPEPDTSLWAAAGAIVCGVCRRRGLAFREGERT
jgi:hypothetical protein